MPLKLANVGTGQSLALYFTAVGKIFRGAQGILGLKKRGRGAAKKEDFPFTKLDFSFLTARISAVIHAVIKILVEGT